MVGEILFVVHEEVFDEDGRAVGVAGGLVEAGGEGVGEGVAFGGVAGPAGGVDVREMRRTLAGPRAVQMALARRTRSLMGMSSVSGTRSWALWPLVWRVVRIWLARSRV